MKRNFTKTTALIFVCALLSLLAVSCNRARPAITQDELVRRTQELMDSAATGDQTPWKKYFAEDSMVFDEKGHNMDKAALLKDLTPLPPGYSGTIKLVKSQSRIFANTAILSYDLDETETVFGQNMTARYHGTDTWMLRNGQWQIIASQMLRYYEDPAPGKADPKKYPTTPAPMNWRRARPQSFPPMAPASIRNEATDQKRCSSPKHQMSSFAKAWKAGASSVATTTAAWTP